LSQRQRPLVLTKTENHTCTFGTSGFCVDEPIPYHLTALGKQASRITLALPTCRAHVWDIDQVDQLLFCKRCGEIKRLGWENSRPQVFPKQP
jgi:hypothetical protein